MRSRVRSLLCLTAALALAWAAAPASAASSSAPRCTGAGLPPDAPLYYMIALPWDYPGNQSPPQLQAGERSRPALRAHLAEVAGKVDTILYFVSPSQGREQFPLSGEEAWLFRETDLNGDAFPDILISEPAGAFFFIRLYAGCGGNYFTPVGAFDSREEPEPIKPQAAAQPAESGTRWAEFAVIAPDPTNSHYSPLVNWAKRIWRFDGSAYRLTNVEPLP